MENIKINKNEKIDDASSTTASDFQEDPFKNYRYEDPFLIEDPFKDQNGNAKVAETGMIYLIYFIEFYRN
jgi:hypothetical protein